MIKEIEDELGKAEVSVKTKPDVDVAESLGVYLHLFDNGDVRDSARFKVSLNFVMPNQRKVFIAPILNTFQASRWLRSVDTDVREYPFYRQALEFKADLKRQSHGIEQYEKTFSAGFFYDKEMGHKCPYDCAYAYMLWLKNDKPRIGFRFFDIAGGLYEMQENEYKGETSAPSWRFTLKEKIQTKMIKGW